MKQSIIALVLIMFAVCTFAEDDAKLDPVQKKYGPQIEYKKKRYIKDIEDIKKLMARDYERLLNSAMQRKDLEVANQYQAKIEALKEGAEGEVDIGTALEPKSRPKEKASNTFVDAVYSFGTPDDRLSIHFHPGGKATLTTKEGAQYEVTYKQSSKSQIDIADGPGYIRGSWKLGREAETFEHRIGTWKRQ